MSIFNINVEEEVMKIMIVKMKASFSPSAVYSRMKIGALDHTLEITERNKIELHWGQNPLTCFLLLLLYHSYLIVASD